MESHTEFHLSEAVKQQINHWLTKYPADQKQSAVLAALHIVQDEQGFVSKPAMKAVAEYLEMPEIAVNEVATFYTMYKLKPTGRNTISVCTNVSCMLCGSNEIVKYLKDKLGVGFGESTPDGKFMLEEVECLAACRNAPAMMLNKTYHENLTPEKLDAILSEVE